MVGRWWPLGRALGARMLGRLPTMRQPLRVPRPASGRTWGCAQPLCRWPWPRSRLLMESSDQGKSRWGASGSDRRPFGMSEQTAQLSARGARVCRYGIHRASERRYRMPSPARARAPPASGMADCCSRGFRRSEQQTKEKSPCMAVRLGSDQPRGELSRPPASAASSSPQRHRC